MATTAASSYSRALDTGGFNHVRAMFGLVVALVGAALVLFLYVRGQPQTVTVLKAARDLPPGTVLQSDDVVPETEPLSDDLSALVVPAADRSSVIGHPLGDGVARGLPLARAQVLDSAQRIPQTAALDGTAPTSPEDIITWLEDTAGGWNADPTPFVWGGPRHARRQRAYLRRHPLGGSGACTTRPIRRRPVALTYSRNPCQVTQ